MIRLVFVILMKWNTLYSDIFILRVTYYLSHFRVNWDEEKRETGREEEKDSEKVIDVNWNVIWWKKKKEIKKK